MSTGLSDAQVEAGLTAMKAEAAGTSEAKRKGLGT
jgi:hypothetical protein